MGFGALAGGLLQYAVQLPLMRREGFRFRFRINLQHPGIRKMGRLIGPAIIGVSAVQINLVVNTQLASFLQDNGPVSWLGYAFRIIYLPIGLFGVAVGIVNLKEVSAFAAHREYGELKETVANSLKLISFLSIPSTVGLMVLAVPVVRVLFERGGFTSADTLFTAYAVMAYSLGLYAYSCVKVYVGTFYALNDTRTPVRISILAVVVNIAVNLTMILLLPQGYKYVGLALGTALSVSLNSTLLAVSFQRKLGKLKAFGMGLNLVKTISAALLMGVVVYLLNRHIRISWGELDLLREILALGLCVLVGLFVYSLSCWLLRIRELSYLIPSLRR
jgi:putative peptidoglycan lipid II flippase